MIAPWNLHLLWNCTVCWQCCGCCCYCWSAVFSIFQTPAKSVSLMVVVGWIIVGAFCVTFIGLILLHNQTTPLPNISWGSDSTLHVLQFSFGTFLTNTEVDSFYLHPIESFRSYHRDLLDFSYLSSLQYSASFSTCPYQQISSNYHWWLLLTFPSNSYCSVIKTHFKFLTLHSSFLSDKSPFSISHSTELPSSLFTHLLCKIDLLSL